MSDTVVHYSVPAGVDEKQNTETLCGADGPRAEPKRYDTVTCPDCRRVLAMAPIREAAA
jgi:hypothetical protein